MPPKRDDRKSKPSNDKQHRSGSKNPPHEESASNERVLRSGNRPLPGLSVPSTSNSSTHFANPGASSNPGSLLSKVDSVSDNLSREQSRENQARELRGQQK